MLPVRHGYGLFLSLLTAFMWGLLPIASALILGHLDVVTLTWVRFTFATFIVFLFLRHRAGLPTRAALPARQGWWLAIAIGALLGNFLLYLQGLDRLDPEATQVLIQIAPFILMAGSVLIFGERFGRWEACGALLLIAGLLLFFNRQLPQLVAGLGTRTVGVLCMLGASVSWGVYGLLQKVLLRSMSSVQLTLLIYAGGTLVLLPFIDGGALLRLESLQAWAVLFCCVNMVVGYGAFTEALQVWQAAKVSAVIALAPVFTILCMPLAVAWWPAYFTPGILNVWSYLGALLVVVGSMLAALGRGREGALQKTSAV